jgi:nicotinamidase/pyrazinamidase
MPEQLTTSLLIIDVQKDFHPGGSLAIPTAGQDAERIAALIRSNPDRIDRIVATMDSHQKLHIAHPGFWCSGGEGNNTSGKERRPAPFTVISADDIAKGVWKPRTDLNLGVDVSQVLDADVFPGMERVQDSSGKFNLDKYCVEYSRLEDKGRFKLCIWPEHCLIGTSGHGVVDCVMDALCEWSEKTGRTVEWIMKGQHLLTEMYSALAAEVPVSKETAFNESLQASLQRSDRLLVCGQAMSHCVNYTLRDIVQHWPANNFSKIELLTDCTSAVPGFETEAESFLEEMRLSGVTLRTSSDVF